MSLYLNTTGNPTLGIGFCARCRRKFALGELAPDPNSPGLYVCREDRDLYDPYRLPPRQADKLVLPFVRPENSVATDPNGVITEDGDLFLTTEDGDDFLVFQGD